VVTTIFNLGSFRQTKEVICAAGLRNELSFTSFRHGGLTELGNADLTEPQIRGLSRQKSSKALPRCVKRTQHQIVAGTYKHRALRDDPGWAFRQREIRKWLQWGHETGKCRKPH
jgi:hypothetical protein